MIKGIVVVNVPQHCEDCNFCKTYIRNPHAFGRPDTYEVYCTVIRNKVLMEVPKGKRPDWCPIHEIQDIKEDEFYKIIKT